MLKLVQLKTLFLLLLLYPLASMAMEKELVVNDSTNITIPFDKDEECCICYENFIKNSATNKEIKNHIESRKRLPITILPCGHVLHFICMVPLFSTTNECPMCREKFPENKQLEKMKKENTDLQSRVGVLETAARENDYSELLPTWQRALVPGLCGLYTFSSEGDPSFPLVVNKLFLGLGAAGVCCHILTQTKSNISFRANNCRENFFKRFFTRGRMEELVTLSGTNFLLHVNKYPTSKDYFIGLAESAITAIGITAINTILDPYMCEFDKKNHLCDIRSLLSFVAVAAMPQIPYAKMAALLIKK